MRAMTLAAALCVGISMTSMVQGQAARPSASAQATPEDVAFRQSALPDTTPNLTKPAIVRQTEPRYTSDAMRQKIAGEVKVEIVVGTTGAVQRARVIESLDKTYGLDDEALKAVKLDVFKPGELNGQPVEVWTTMTLTFRLH